MMCKKIRSAIILHALYRVTIYFRGNLESPTSLNMDIFGLREVKTQDPTQRGLETVLHFWKKLFKSIKQYSFDFADWGALESRTWNDSVYLLSGFISNEMSIFWPQSE